jgi:hypothetical protein
MPQGQVPIYDKTGFEAIYDNELLKLPDELLK